ncbi:MAG: VOC family protein [Candidatus Cloacimonetes bacterium]|nr:VOC family protein [Candidatus Cloacimonadota bacterium]
MKLSFADTMINAKDYKTLVQFYLSVANFEIDLESDLYTLLKDPVTSQVLCICNGSPLSSTGPGFKTSDFDASLASAKALGSTLIHQGANQDKSFQYAAFEDPEGNPFLIWFGEH